MAFGSKQKHGTRRKWTEEHLTQHLWYSHWPWDWTRACDYIIIYILYNLIIRKYFSN